MLYVRAILFSVLVPGMLAFIVPGLIAPGPGGGAGHPGWILAGVGTLGYAISAVSFLLEGGGTPAIFFTRPLRAVLGEEPRVLVRGWLYEHTRNPMYQSVVMAVMGQAWARQSAAVALYGAGLAVFFHFIVVFVEEPHLRQRAGYGEYCARVHRWGWSLRGNKTQEPASNGR